LSAFLGGVDLKLPRCWFQRSFLEAAVKAGKLLFAQLMDFLPWTSFARSVARYGGDRRVRNLSCAEQFRAVAFAQLTCRESLRDIEACLNAQPAKLYPIGFRSPVMSTSSTRSFSSPEPTM
jgi:hypothetical protein